MTLFRNPKYFLKKTTCYVRLADATDGLLPEYREIDDHAPGIDDIEVVSNIYRLIESDFHLHVVVFGIASGVERDPEGGLGAVVLDTVVCKAAATERAIVDQPHQVLIDGIGHALIGFVVEEGYIYHVLVQLL